MKAFTRIKRMFTLAGALAMTGWLLFALFTLLGGGADGAHAASSPLAEIHVCPSSCTYSSIQSAVDAAKDGDVIKVAQGTYTDVHIREGITQVVYLSKTITLRGGYPGTDWDTSDPVAYPTILDAQEQGRVMVIKGTITPRIEGFHLTGGDAAGLGGSVYGDDGGGGLYVLYGSAVISGNQIYANTADRGGGTWLQDGDFTFQGNVVRENDANWSGAGVLLYRSPATLEGNDIISNTAVYAGGMMLHLSDATVRGNVILSNTATTSEGGGIAVTSSDATLEDNLVSGNRVNEAGGGLYLNDSNATVINNVIADNYAHRLGSGVHVRGCSPHLIHNTIARNGGLGGGLFATVSHFGDVFSHVMLTNTIVFSHTEGVIASTGNTITLRATLWHDNLTPWIGPGTVTHTLDYYGDPAFAEDGYHLTSGSAARDVGIATGVTTDIDGEPRPAGAGHDLGADEARVWTVQLPMILSP